MALPRTQVLDGPPRSRYEGVRMSEAEFLALPEEKPALEYWDSTVLQKAVTKRRHGQIAELFILRLYFYRMNHGGRSLPEPTIYFSGQGYLVPDVAYWAPETPQGDDDRMLPPTLAVEIRSPGESLRQQRQKCRWMRANGVPVCWFIDPERRIAERFEGEDDGSELPADGALTSPLLPGFALPLADIWAELDR